MPPSLRADELWHCDRTAVNQEEISRYEVDPLMDTASKGSVALSIIRFRDTPGVAYSQGSDATGSGSILGTSLNATEPLSRLIVLQLLGLARAGLPLHQVRLNATDQVVEHQRKGGENDDTGHHRVDVKAALSLQDQIAHTLT